MLRLAIDDPRTEAEVQSVLRASLSATGAGLGDVAARARKLGTMHGAWPAWLAAGIADRKRSRWTAARDALAVALETAPGASPAHFEMAGVLMGMGHTGQAVTHAEQAVAIEGGSARALKVLARALLADGQRAASLEAAHRALALRPGDDDLRASIDEMLREPPAKGWSARLREALSGLARRVSGRRR